MPTEHDPGSVTNLIGDLKAGDREAVQPLWDRYFERLVRLARAKLKLRAAARTESDEEDAALSAFDSFCVGVDRGNFPVLTDRDDLWRLLVKITARKALDQVERQRAKVRDSRRTLNEAAGSDPSGEGRNGFDWMPGREPTPEFAAMVAEGYWALLDALPNDDLRRVAVAKMEGYTTDEIAAILQCSSRTIGNRLKLIRMMWNREYAHV